MDPVNCKGELTCEMSSDIPRRVLSTCHMVGKGWAQADPGNDNGGGTPWAQQVCSCLWLGTRAGRVLELTRSSHSKLKVVWHQFSTVQFPSHQFVWKVQLVEFRAQGQNDYVQVIQYSSFT